MKTISGTDIDNYVVLNMVGLKEIVDAVGTIEVIPPTSIEIGEYLYRRSDYGVR